MPRKAQEKKKTRTRKPRVKVTLIGDENICGYCAATLSNIRRARRGKRFRFTKKAPKPGTVRSIPITVFEAGRGKNRVVKVVHGALTPSEIKQYVDEVDRKSRKKRRRLTR